MRKNKQTTVFSKLLLTYLLFFFCVGWVSSAMANTDSVMQSNPQIPHAPQRIVVFPLFAEEMLLEMIGPERIVYVGHEYYENGETYSPTMGLTKHIKGQYWSMSDEKEILALSPDLIVLKKEFSLDYKDIFPELHQANIPFLFLDTPKSIDDIRNTLLYLGEEVGAPKKAAQMVEAMEIGLAQIAEIVAGIPEEKLIRAIYYEYWSSEDGESTSWYMQLSFIMAAHAAGIIAEGPDTADFVNGNSDDLLAELNPDLITFAYTSFDTDGSVYDITRANHAELIDTLRSNPTLSNIPAVKNHAIYPIRLCESQFIVQSALELARLAYPELFPEKAQ